MSPPALTNTCSMCGQRLERLLAAGFGSMRQGAKARDAQLLALDLLREHAARGFGLGRIAIQEHEARGELRRELEPASAATARKNARRHLDQQAAAVAGLAVGGDRAAMRQAVQGADGGLQHPVARLIVEARDQAEAAGVPLIAPAIQAPIRGREDPLREAGLKSGMWLLRHIDARA
jgi:hypothetical protein